MSPNVNARNRMLTVATVIAVAMMFLLPSAMQLSDNTYSKADDPVQTYSVSYDINSAVAIGTVPASGSYAEGSEVTVLFDEIPSNKSYAFVGWELFQGDTSLGTFYPDESRNDPSTGLQTSARKFTMPAADVVLKAVWSTDADTMVIVSAGPVVIDYQSGNYVVTSEGSVVGGTEGINNFIIRSSVNTWSDGISILNTAAKDSESRLRVVLGNLASTYLRINTGSSSPSPLAVLNSSYVTLQISGGVTFQADNPSAAIINVAPAAEILIIGENNKSSGSGGECTLSLVRPNALADPITAAGIGGNGLQDAGIVRVESGYTTITSGTTNWNHGSGIGGGGASTMVNTTKGAYAPYFEINGGMIYIYTKGEYLTGAGVGGGGTMYGTGGDSGYVAVNGGTLFVSMSSTDAHVFSAGVGGGGTSSITSNLKAGSMAGFIQSGGTVDVYHKVDTTLGTGQVYGAGIGGGGIYYGTAGTIGTVDITGGNIMVSMTGGTGRGIYGAGIGGGGTYSPGSFSGAGSKVSITGSSTVMVQMTAAGDINGAGIGGGGSVNGTPGSNGTTTVESAMVYVMQASSADMIAGAGIGGGGHTYNIRNDGSGGTITIRSGVVYVAQTSAASGLNSAAIGGGGGYTSGGVPGSGGTITIDGGSVTLIKGGATVCRGTAIGGGGRCDTDNKGSSGYITINGGSIDIAIAEALTNSTVAIGGGTASYVTINGGTITIFGTPSSAQDIGTYSHGMNSLVINGGSISLMNDGILTDAVNSQGSLLYKVVVNLGLGNGVALPNEKNLYSVLVKSAGINDGMYRDFHILSKHPTLAFSAVFDTNLYLYLPSSATEQEISAEVTSDGQVKWYTAAVSNFAVSAVIQDGANIYYRVLYQGTGLRFRYDTVQVVINGTFADVLESGTGDDTDGAPHSISMTMAGAEVPAADYTYTNYDNQSPTSSAGQMTGPTVTGKLIVTADSEDLYKITYLDLANSSNSYTTYVYAGESTNLAGADLFAPPSGQAFVGWKYFGGIMPAGEEYTPTSDMVFYAEWVSSLVDITITGSNFSVLYPTPTSSGGNVYEANVGSDFTFILQFASGYDPGSAQFTVTGTGTVTGSNGVYKVPNVASDLTISVSVSKFTYGVTVETDDTGNFYTLDKSQDTVEYGTVFTFVLTPAGTHELSEFTPVVNGVVRAFNSDGSLSVTITETTTINISHGGQHYIAIPEGAGYTTSPVGGGSVSDGGQFVFTVTLAQGYSVEDTTISFDGGPYGELTAGQWVNGVREYTIDDITGNITVTITAEKTQYEVKVPKSTSYTISSSSGQDNTDADYLILKAAYGEDVSFALTASEGYDITRFTAAAASGGSNGSIFAGQSGTWLVHDIIGDMVLQINAAKYQYEILFSLTNCGTSYSGNIETVEWGDGVDITILPFAGYKYKTVSVTGESGLYAWSYNDYTKVLSIMGIKTDIQVTAVCEAETYTITYDPNGGSGGPPSGSAAYNSQYTILGTPEPEKEGYIFRGWSTSPNASDPEFGEDETVTVTSSLTLYAVWEEDSVTVTFNPNYSGPSSFTQSFLRGVEGTLTYQTFTRTGYTFIGWAGEGETTVEYLPGGNITLNADMDLYPIWTPTTVTVTFDANLGTGAPAPQTFDYETAEDLTSDTPTRSGFAFLGWSTDPNSNSAVYTAGQSASFTADITLYAVWSANPLTVTYSAGTDGTGEQKVQNTHYGNYLQLYDESQGGFTRDGYHMAGWTTTEGSPTVFYGFGQTIWIAVNLTLYPAWEQDEASDVTITFDPDYSGGPSAFTQTIQSGVQTQLTYQTFTRTGYTFRGWSESQGSASADYQSGGNITLTESTTLYAVWEVIEVTVSFNANGGAGTMADQVIDYGTAENLSINSFTRTGYTFQGWSEDPNGTATYADQASVTLYMGAVLYAVWSKIQLTITYTAGSGATGEDVTGIFLYDEYGSLSGLPAGWSMDEYTLTGWTDGTNTYGISELAKFTSNMTLTGIWTHDSPGDITITYDANGASGSYSETWQENVQGTLGYPRAILEGHTFLGWKVGTTDTILAAGATASFAAATMLYAQWDPIEIMVTFNANKGAGAPSPQSFEYGVTENLTTDVPTRTGYTFNGWSTDPNATSAAYTAGGSASFTADTILYAVWSANPLTVTYSAGADGTGSQNVQNTFYDVHTQLYDESQGGFTRDGYHMAGWTDTDGGTTIVYGFGQTVLMTASLTLYPVWEQDEASDVTITFDPDYSGGPSTFTQTVSSGASEELTYQTFSRNGYTFMGWSGTQGSASADYLPGGNITLTTDTTLYAVWEVIEVTVSFNASGGTGTMADQVMEYGTAEYLSPYSFTRTGYTFTGWSADPNGTVTYSDGAQVTLTADTTLYAVWSKIQLTITYTAGSGATGEDVTDMFLYDEYGNLSGLPAGWSMDEYTLTGWTDGTNTYNLNGLAKFTSDTTLTGIWTHDSPGNITITYDANGAAGGYTETWQENVQGTLGYPRAVLEGHTFAGWKVGTTDTVLAAGANTSFAAATTLFAQWTPMTVTVTFDANLGTNAPAAQPFSYGVAADLTTDVPTRTGYTFNGWSADPNASSAAYSAGEESTFTADTTLYAVWSANALTATYSAGTGGTGSQKIQNTFYGNYLQLYDESQGGFTRDGYHMAGWTDTDGGTTAVYGFGQTVQMLADLVLYPVWEQDTPADVVITFDPHYTSGQSTFTQTVQSGVQTQLTYQTFLRVGYTFVGWSETQGSTTAEYLSGGNITVTSDITLYAVWENIMVTVLFNANGGTGTMDGEMLNYGQTADLKANTYARTGYSFLGWSADPNKTTATYADQASVTLYADTILYAVWSATALTITYEPGTDGTGSQKVQNAYYDDYIQMYTEPQGGFTRDGYHMTGWADTDGSTTVLYGLGYTVQMSADLVLYPVWEIDGGTQDTVIMTFDSDYSGGPPTFTRSVPSGVSTALTYQTFARDGYNFLGWATVSGGAAVYQPGDSITVTSATTLYAVWSMIQVTATFDANLGTGGPTSQTFNHGVSDALDSSQPTRDGYDFIGWSADPNATSATYSSGDTVSFTADTMLYAAWSATAMTITYDPGSLGTGSPMQQSTYYNEYVQLYTDAQTGFTRDGYHILGWSDIDNDTAILYRLGDMAYVTGNITLYPVWDLDSDLVEVTLTFNPGYSGQTAFTQVVYSDVQTALTHRTFARTGYNFLGWATTSGGSAVYQPGDMITVSSDTTLYAVWATVSVTVTFDANLGTGGPYTQSFNYGVPAPLSTAQPTRAGYSFVGWSTDPNATSAVYSSGDTALFTTATTLYAVWTGATVSVTYSLADGTWDDSNTASAKVGGTYKISSTVPTKDGYTFRGWNTNADGTGITYGSGESAVVPAGGLQLYAIWDNSTTTAVVAIQSSGGEGQFTYSTDGSHPTDDCQNLIITAQTGDMVRIMAATPPENTKFDCWIVDGVKYYDSEISVRADGAQTVYANFVPTNPESSVLGSPLFWIALIIVGLASAAVVYVIMRNSGKEEAEQ